MKINEDPDKLQPPKHLTKASAEVRIKLTRNYNSYEASFGCISNIGDVPPKEKLQVIDELKSYARAQCMELLKDTFGVTEGDLK